MRAAYSDKPVGEAEARRIAASTGMPGCLAFPHSRPAPAWKLAANGIDIVLDREVMGWEKQS